MDAWGARTPPPYQQRSGHNLHFGFPNLIPADTSVYHIPSSLWVFIMSISFSLLTLILQPSTFITPFGVITIRYVGVHPSHCMVISSTTQYFLLFDTAGISNILLVCSCYCGLEFIFDISVDFNVDHYIGAFLHSTDEKNSDMTPSTGFGHFRILGVLT